MHRSKLRIIVVAQIVYMIQAMPKKVNMPMECEKQNFCYKTDNNYPYEEISSIMQKYNIDITDKEIKENKDINENKTETEERIDDKEVLIKQPCNSVIKNDPIYYIKDEHGDVRYVVQSNNSTNLVKFHVVQCRYPGLLEPSVLFPSKEEICKYNIRCVNRLVRVQFLVLSHDMQGVEMVTIKDGLPMACSCEYDPVPRSFQDCINDNENLDYNYVPDDYDYNRF